ncbi:MAG TPA: hypothetical protein VMY18_07135 [Acidobacteriota bacterium]|nr:hypothetical protein [Acidobacteriota bacterium]
MSEKLDIKNLILVPAIITLGISCLRLTGELLGWAEKLFGRAAGGGASLVGIAWLVPVFGIYYGWKLTKMGNHARSPGKLIGFSLLSFIILAAVTGALMTTLPSYPTFTLILMSTTAVGTMFLLRSSWPELFRTLLCYGFAARIPVILIMFLAIMGNWGTHYDSPPPELEGMHWFLEWVITGLIPQATVWIWYTVVVGGLFAGLAALVFKKS